MDQTYFCQAHYSQGVPTKVRARSIVLRKRMNDKLETNVTLE